MTGAALWDLDGTLVDSEEHHWRAWQEIMAAEGIPITREQFVATFGLRNSDFLPGWLGERASPEHIAHVTVTKEALYRKLLREGGATALPGAVEWVRKLHENGWRQAIASSAPRENVEVVLEVLGLASFFQALVAAEDVTAGKPDPQVFLTAAARLEFPPARCVVVEDAPTGIEGARRAGMHSIGVRRNGRLAADIAVSSLLDLPGDAFAGLIRK